MISPAIEQLRQLVHERSGIVLGADKAYLFESRLGPVLRTAGLTGLPALAAALRAAPDGPLASQVVSAMTTNETFFFRDIAPFTALAATVLPAVLARRQRERRLSIWCAAASTGQEPYSIALVLREHFPETATWQIDFHATDLSTEVLERARTGRFRQLEIERGLPPDLLARWFTREQDDWVVHPDLRQMIRFSRLNLLAPWPIAAPLDVIFLRNVLIYFDVATKRAVLQRARRLLHPAGFLFLGSGESPMGLDDALERVPIERAGCYRLAAGNS